HVIVRAADVPTAFKSAFPQGASLSSNRWGVSTELQLPTRWFTLTAKAFTGADLRFYFVGELYSNFNDIAGISCPQDTTCSTNSLDGSSTVFFGYNANGD